MPRLPGTRAVARAGWRDPRPTRATPCAARDPQTSAIHRVPVPRSANVALFSAAAGVMAGRTAAFFYLLGNRVASYACGPGDASQWVAFQQLLVHLCVLPGFLRRRRLEILMLSAGLALAFGSPGAVGIAANFAH